MVHSDKINTKAKFCYLGAFFLLLLLWAMIQPKDSVPDEKMKYDICNYIFLHGKLPNGGDPAIRNPVWGISYGFTPILAYMISAIFMKIIALFTHSVVSFYLAARLTSVLCMTGMAYFVIKIAERVFEQTKHRWLFIVGITMLPQVIFLGSYINNDSLALFSIAMILYAWLRGIQDGWKMGNCILLGGAIGICALSYYNAYGYLLTSVFVYFISARKQEMFAEHRGVIWKRAFLITAVALLIAGWWFVRSAILYDGDFLGLRTSNSYAQQYAMDGYKPSNIANPLHTGESLFHMLFVKSWILSTVVSFIATFGQADIRLPLMLYLPYGLLILAGLWGLFDVRRSRSLTLLWKEKRTAILVEWVFVVNIMISIGLSIYYSYCNDYQPQGRYVMPMLIPLFYFLSRGLCTVLDRCSSRRMQSVIYVVLAVFYLAVPVYSLKLIA